MQENLLKIRAEEFEKNVEDCLVDSDGLLRSALDINTMKPYSRDYFTGDMDIIRNEKADIGNYSDMMEYENAGMVSGAYLRAMLSKYAVTKDTGALDKAYRTFYGIKHLFDRSGSVEEGYFCKPYGGQVTLETSSDQYIYALTALDEFYKYAGKAERDMAADMIIKMSRYWKDRDYTRDYFGKPLKWPLNRFTGFAWLNYVYSGDEGMKAELERLASLEEVQGTLPFAGMSIGQLMEEYNGRQKYYIEQKHGGMIMGGGAGCAQSGALSIESCLEYNAPMRGLWLKQLEGLYERAKISIGEDGLELQKGIYRSETGEYEAVNPPMYVNGDPPPGALLKILTYAGNIRSGMHSAMFARAVVYANEYFPSEEKVELARRILEGVSHDRLKNYIDPEGHLLPEMKWKETTYSGDAVANWLWAYWQGGSRGLW